MTSSLLLTAVGIEIGRIVYVRGEVGKAADAAALAAAAGIECGKPVSADGGCTPIYGHGIC